MEIGVGLPSNLDGTSGQALTDWAVRAESLSFATLAATDRMASSTWDPLIALAAAAAVTTKCRLLTNVVIVPNRGSAGQLAKQMMTIDQLSAGRFIAGVGVGDREDDYAAAGQPMTDRHRRLDRMLDEIRAIWNGSDALRARVGPRFAEGGPPILIGGRSPSTFRRAAACGIGWTVAISSPDQVRDGVRNLRLAWAKAGRFGEPRVVALTYFGLGAAAEQGTPAYLRGYYEFLGPLAEIVAAAAPTDERAISATIAAYADAGADELIFLPTLAGVEQLDLLAAAARLSLPSAASG